MGAGAPALLLERAGRARGGAAGNHVARADADGRAAIDQVDRIRATGGEAARQGDHVAGAARLHREVQVFVDERIDDNAGVAAPLTLIPPVSGLEFEVPFCKICESLTTSLASDVLLAMLMPLSMK